MLTAQADSQHPRLHAGPRPGAHLQGLFGAWAAHHGYTPGPSPAFSDSAGRPRSV